MLELTLTRLFSATMYYHFAFMAISVALFGSGASGVFVYILQRRLGPERIGVWLTIASWLFALGSLLALYEILHNPLSLKNDAENYHRLIYVYASTAVPFFFSGCIVTLAITRYAAEINRLYLFDLAGAAVGCLLLIPVLNSLGAINVVVFVAVVAALVGTLFSIASGRRALAAISVLLAASIASLLVYNVRTNRIDIHEAKGEVEQDVLFSKWNSFSRITVQGDLAASRAEIKIDADAATSIVRNGGDIEGHEYQRNTIEALAYHLKKDGNVLIIGPGGGNDVMAARVFGMKRITAVEVNPIIARNVMSSEPFKSYSGSIYQQPEVHLAVDEGRSFIRSSSNRYDIIQATMVDTWAATAAGAFALTENNLYTVEAFKDYINHLNPDGVLTMTRWYFDPPDQLLRLISITREAMDDLGIDDAQNHIMIVRRDFGDYTDRTAATYLFKKTAFTDSDVAEIEKTAQANGFIVVYTPKTRPENLITELISSPNPSALRASFEDNINPSTDNNPFFFNSVKVSHLSQVVRGKGEWAKTNLGTLVLFALFLITAVMVLLFIVGPLFITQGRALATRTSTKLWYLVYFACLGAGFIIVEVAMIQKFILFLGHPVYSLTVVLFSLLTFSGLGSYFSKTFDEDRLPPLLLRVIAILVALVFVYIVALPPIFYGLVQLARPIRIVIAVVLMAPIATVMGMPMPAGIKVLNRHMPGIIPWAWGVNGATSVMGSVAALAIALLTGFNQALVVGAVLYTLAALAVTKASSTNKSLQLQKEQVAEALRT